MLSRTFLFVPKPKGLINLAVGDTRHVNQNRQIWNESSLLQLQYSILQAQEG